MKYLSVEAPEISGLHLRKLLGHSPFHPGRRRLDEGIYGVPPAGARSGIRMRRAEKKFTAAITAPMRKTAW